MILELGSLPERWLLGMTLSAPLDAGVWSRCKRMVIMFSNRFRGGWTCGMSSLIDHGWYPGTSFFDAVEMVRSWCQGTDQLLFSFLSNRMLLTGIIPVGRSFSSVLECARSLNVGDF